MKIIKVLKKKNCQITKVLWITFKNNNKSLKSILKSMTSNKIKDNFQDKARTVKNHQ